MDNPEKFQVISSQAGNSRPWLSANLRTRARLASSGSDFLCDPACTRPGCKNQDLQVQVSLVDLLGVALHREEPVAANFPGRYSLGLFANEREDWIRMVALKLQKPCPFLENDLCAIYPVRPLPCVLFPEYLVAEGRFQENAGKEHFRDYLCFKRPFLLSPARAQVMATLKKMWARESIISSLYLFNHGPCHLDFSNLLKELGEAAGRLRAGEAAERPEPLRLIPNRVLERFFGERIAQCQPFAGVSEKLQHLQSPEGQAQFLQLLQDERLLKKLQQDGGGRALVFQFVKGRLKARRRSLLPPEYKYY